MAGMEIVVRPVVFPNIRPRARQSLPPLDDPEKGMAVISGNPAGSIGNSYSWSASSSYSRPTETERRVDEVQVFQMDKDGKVNKDNFIITEIANRITTWEPTSDGKPRAPGGPIWSNVTNEEKATYYQRLREADNIKILTRDKIVKNPDVVGGDE